MRRREFALLVGPSMIVMFGLLLLPLVRTVQWSFQDVQYGEAGVFVGLQNYVTALTDARFGRAVAFTVILTLLVTTCLVVLGYIIATQVNRLGRLRPVVLGILLVSYVLPNVVGSAAFSWLFDTNFGGVVNHLLSGVTDTEILWFTDVWPNRIMIVLNTVWHLLPFSMLIILAGLQGVPDEILEAAEIDGASPLKVHLDVIIPTIRGVLATMAPRDRPARAKRGGSSSSSRSTCDGRSGLVRPGVVTSPRSRPDHRRSEQFIPGSSTTGSPPLTATFSP